MDKWGLIFAIVIIIYLLAEIKSLLLQILSSLSVIGDRLKSLDQITDALSDFEKPIRLIESHTSNISST